MATVTVYGRPDCEDTERAREFLLDYGISFIELNIDEDREAEAFVLRMNNEERITPTIIIGHDEDQTILSEPSNDELARALIQHGFAFHAR
jgi:glutaredoxin